jgi:hypothetical protein
MSPSQWLKGVVMLNAHDEVSRAREALAYGDLDVCFQRNLVA